MLAAAADRECDVSARSEPNDEKRRRPWAGRFGPSHPQAQDCLAIRRATRSAPTRTGAAISRSVAGSSPLRRATEKTANFEARSGLRRAPAARVAWVSPLGVVGQRFSAFGRSRPDSLFREGKTGVRKQPWGLASDPERDPLELSKSLVNDPLKVNEPVRLGPRKGLEPWHGGHPQAD
jgi:hypothetical protein